MDLRYGVRSGSTLGFVAVSSTALCLCLQGQAPHKDQAQRSVLLSTARQLSLLQMKET